MNDYKVIGKDEFKVAIDEFSKLFLNPYEILRLICYPLTNQRGDQSCMLQLVIWVDGVFTDILEQRQDNINNIKEIDMNLARYKLQDIDYENPEILEDGEIQSCKITIREISIEVREIEEK